MSLGVRQSLSPSRQSLPIELSNRSNNSPTAGAIQVNAAVKPPAALRVEQFRVDDPLESAELAQTSSVDARLSLLEDEEAAWQ